MKASMIVLAMMVVMMQEAVPQNPLTGMPLIATGMIRSATFMERSPEFTDLYQIQTSDKGRQIFIYCNSSYCYRQRNQTVNA